MRKSKIFDASGNSLVKPGKKIINRKTNDQCDGQRKSTSSDNTPFECSEDADNFTETVGSKALLRRPTFKEVGGKFRNTKGTARLLKSQSLDNDPLARPPTPGSKTNLQSVKEVPKTGLKGLSRRAREVFLKTPDSCPQAEVISSKQSFMGRLFQR